MQESLTQLGGCWEILLNDPFQVAIGIILLLFNSKVVRSAIGLR